MNRVMKRDSLVGKVVKVKYHRIQGYPAGSEARVLGYYGGTIEQPVILYELEFSDGTVILVPRDEIRLRDKETENEKNKCSQFSC